MARGSDSDSCTVLSAPRGGRTAVVEASVSLDYFTRARLCEQIDVAVAPALIDGHYYHVAPLAEKARIAQEGLVGGEAARRRNFPAYPRDPDCVYLWPAVVMAQTYADRDDQHLGAGAHLILEADLTSLDELCPDQEELARLWEEPEAFPGGEALKTRMEAERHTLPEGRTDSPAVLEAAIALIRALSPETRLLAVNVLALNGDPIMWRGPITPEDLSVCELNELDALYERSSALATSALKAGTFSRLENGPLNERLAARLRELGISGPHRRTV
jgi:hypothetical protein